MIYRRAFVAEVLGQSVTAMCLLGLVLMLVSTTRALAGLADIAFDAPTLLLLVALGMLRHIPLLLSFALLAGLLGTFDRMRSDRELLFWEVAGVGPFGWMRPILGVALPFAVVSGAMAVEGSPWAGRTLGAIKRQASDEAEIVGRSGAFGEIGRLGIVYHITPDRTVLLRQQDTHNNVIITRGDIAEEGETRELRLSEGLLYSLERDGGRAQEIRFGGGNISITPPEEAVNLRLKSTSFRDLDLGSRNGQAEFAWRVGLPASLLLLALMVPLVVSRKARRTRSGSFLLAIIGYWFVYSVASLAKELGADPGPAPAMAVALLPHAALAAALVLLAARAAAKGGLR